MKTSLMLIALLSSLSGCIAVVPNKPVEIKKPQPRVLATMRAFGLQDQKGAHIADVMFSFRDDNSVVWTEQPVSTAAVAAEAAPVPPKPVPAKKKSHKKGKR